MIDLSGLPDHYSFRVEAYDNRWRAVLTCYDYDEDLIEEDRAALAQKTWAGVEVEIVPDLGVDVLQVTGVTLNATLKVMLEARDFCRAYGDEISEFPY